jgi:hypothetical protein
MDIVSDHIDVYFKIHYITRYGQALYIVGSTIQLGEWQPSKAIKLQWNHVHFTVIIYLQGFLLEHYAQIQPLFR